jgi:hypothetical protein
MLVMKEYITRIGEHILKLIPISDFKSMYKKLSSGKDPIIITHKNSDLSITFTIYESHVESIITCYSKDNTFIMPKIQDGYLHEEFLYLTIDISDNKILYEEPDAKKAQMTDPEKKTVEDFIYVSNTDIDNLKHIYQSLVDKFNIKIDELFITNINTSIGIKQNKIDDYVINKIRDLLIEIIDFDELDKVFRDHYGDKDFYALSNHPYTMTVEKIKVEDEDECEKYKFHLGSIKRDSCPGLNSLRRRYFYSDNMKEAFLLDDEEIKSYDKKLFNDTCHTTFKIPAIEYMIYCELILNHDKSIYSYKPEASVNMADTLSIYRETLKTIDEPKLAVLYDWLKEEFDFAKQYDYKLSFKGVNINGR